MKYYLYLHFQQTKLQNLGTDNPLPMQLLGSQRWSASSLLSKPKLSIQSSCAFPCMQTHTHTYHRILELKESYVYCLPLTNWSCTPFDTKALSSHDYGQQIIYKTAQQCSTRTHVLSVTDTTQHNTTQHNTTLHSAALSFLHGQIWHIFQNFQYFRVFHNFFLENWLNLSYVSRLICNMLGKLIR